MLRSRAYVEETLVGIPEFGGRVYLNVHPAKAALPLVTYTVTEMNMFPTLENQNRIISADFELVIQTATNRQVEELLRKIQDAFDRSDRARLTEGMTVEMETETPRFATNMLCRVREDF